MSSTPRTSSPDPFTSSYFDTKTIVVVRMEPDQYEKLEKSLTPPTVTTQTTELLAGYQLGVQEVLKKLRSGYVVSR